MSRNKEKLLLLIEEMTEKEMEEVIDFIKMKREKEKASESSMEFWDNEVDDEVWNDA
ncbi:DUF2281 domain-containing protein [Natribacillus halophilus]|uniref:DUF2281 domain-containing protein n=1 Tax=Natribacillus halophilus TaxID=549003 RepID=A0A1G8QP08_9BACI|nr:DUF2281 domain-containing protein [Natribacillus halophilus]SDJ06437.1 hypothetical protein SAMN04488123_11328 [Natribacillus halophilus]